MDIEKLIKLADLLDSRGEYEAASEIDELLKRAVDEPTDPNIEQSRWLEEELKKMKTEPAPGLSTPIDDEPTEPDWPIDEEEQGRWDEEETEKMINAFEGAVDKAKRMLNMATSYPHYIQLHATGEVAGATEALNKMSAYIKDQLRMAREGDMADDPISDSDTEIDEMLCKVRNALELGSTYDIQLDEDEVSNAIRALDRFHKHIESQIGGARTNSMADTFASLAKVADDLDEAGAQKEADMIDDFLKRYAQEGPTEIGELPEVEEKSMGSTEMGESVARRQAEAMDEVTNLVDSFGENKGSFLYDLRRQVEYLINEFERGKQKEKKEHVNRPYAEYIEGYEPGTDPFAETRRHFSQKMEASTKNKFSKRAEDYDEDRKEEADTEQSKRYDSKYHHSLQVREPKKDQERVDREGRKEHHVETYKKNEAHHLSTRYCPEHIGTQMARVGEGIYQCPLDGQCYNWEAGWTDFDGNQHPGGSVAAQTPDSTGYAIPHRIFDSREKVLNVVN
jgi:hypothetical protein